MVHWSAPTEAQVDMVVRVPLLSQGKPIMSDEDFNALKAELKQKASVVAAEGPRCSIRTKKMYSDCQVREGCSQGLALFLLCRWERNRRLSCRAGGP